jgi:hypothetical protein
MRPLSATSTCSRTPLTLFSIHEEPIGLETEAIAGGDDVKQQL